MSAVKFLLEIKIFKKMIKGGIIFISTEVWLKEFMFEIEPRLTFFTDQYTYHLSVIFTIFNQKPCNISHEELNLWRNFWARSGGVVGYVEF